MADSGADEREDQPAAGQASAEGIPEVGTDNTKNLEEEARALQQTEARETEPAEHDSKNSVKKETEASAAEAEEEGDQVKATTATEAPSSRNGEHRKQGRYKDRYNDRKLKSKNKFDPASLPDTDDPVAIRKQVCRPACFVVTNWLSTDLGSLGRVLL
jgi:hypothetical protein